MSNNKIHISTDYYLFEFSEENRNVNLTNATSKKLRESMSQYGWLKAFPIMCRKDEDGNLIIVDGQHRFSIARELGIPIHYVVDETDIDIAEVNAGQKSWSVKDYLKRWQRAGKEDYFEIEEFRQTHPSVPLGMTIALLGGSISFSSRVRKEFRNGTYKINPEHRGLAYRVANTYESIVESNSSVKHANLLKAIYSCFFVEDFDSQRLVETAEKYPHLLQSYSKKDDYLDMLEEVYNHNKRSGKIPLAFQAKNAMKENSSKILN